MVVTTDREAQMLSGDRNKGIPPPTAMGATRAHGAVLAEARLPTGRPLMADLVVGGHDDRRTSVIATIAAGYTAWSLFQVSHENHIVYYTAASVISCQDIRGFLVSVIPTAEGTGVVSSFLHFAFLHKLRTYRILGEEIPREFREGRRGFSGSAFASASAFSLSGWPSIKKRAEAVPVNVDVFDRVTVIEKTKQIGKQRNKHWS